MFTIEQTYTLAGLTALCRAGRKTVRGPARIPRLILWAFFLVLAVLVAVSLSLGLSPGVLAYVVLVAIPILLLTEDRLNAWIAQRQLLPGSAHSVTVFTPDSYTVTTDTTETIYQYENITQLCETQRYFIFFLGKRHGQMFDKSCFQSGTAEAFRAFIEEKTGLLFRTVK